MAKANMHRENLRRRFSAGRWILVSRDMLGCMTIEEAFVLCYFCSIGDQRAEKYPKEQEWFLCSTNKALYNLRTSRRVLDRIIGRLKNIGVIETKQMGVPAKRFVRIDYEKLELLIDGVV